MNPDVSFIIAAYNVERTLDAAIGSALQQSDISCEVIVVDDQSSDGTAAVAQSFTDTRVKYLSTEKNSGPGAARNIALDAAVGHWVAVLDADDRMIPTRLTNMLALAEEAGAQIIVDNMIIRNLENCTDHILFNERELKRLSDFSFEIFVRGNTLFSQDITLGYLKPVLRRSFLEEHCLRYDETLRIGEDFLFLAACLSKGGHCEVEQDPGYIYHIHHRSISHRLELHHIHAMQKADDRFLSQYSLSPSMKHVFADRSRNLREAASFLKIVEYLKRKAFFSALKESFLCPKAVRYLQMPAATRIKRFSKRLGGSI